VIKQTIEISQESAHLAVKHKQLQIKREGNTVGQVPCEDIGMVLVDHPGTTYTHHALTSLADSDAAVVICGRNHLPAAILLPLSDHSQVVWRHHDQIAAGKPLCKRLWQQIVKAKIIAQADNLEENDIISNQLRQFAKQVRSGDPSNIEARAAKLYWQHWLGEEDFRRDRDQTGINSLLNYGYAVMRAALARAIVAAGLLPALGVHHHNRGNPFCLADDLIEPLRPLVDDRVRELYRQGHTELSQVAKAGLLELLTEQITISRETGPLMVSLHKYVASLVRCFAGQAKQLEIPQPC